MVLKFSPNVSSPASYPNYSLIKFEEVRLKQNIYNKDLNQRSSRVTPCLPFPPFYRGIRML